MILKKTILWLFLFFLGGSVSLSASDSSPNGSYPCAFCNPDVIERQVFFQGEEVLGILTHKPVVKGHVLIIPKRHVERFEDLSGSEMLEIQETIQKVDRAVRGLMGTSGYLLIQKNGREAGQTVPHVHFHYLPRSKWASQAQMALKFLLADWQRALSAEEMAPFIEELKKSL